MNEAATAIDLIYARSQMGVSLAFHIIFAAIGIALPAFMVVAEWQWLRTGDEAWRELARRWSKGTAIFFAVGAVSGTVLSFELGLLWPHFMEFSGAVVGLPFAMEGFAFFTEAIFLAVYLYGWDRVAPKVHLFAGIVVALSGAASGFFVTLANAWMNYPVGFEVADGMPVDIRPLEAMFPPGWFSQVVHVLLSSYIATAFAVAGIHAWLILRGRPDRFHRNALAVTLVFGGVCALLQPLSGDFEARSAAELQPVKLAAMEAHFDTAAGAPLRIGGWPDPDEGVTRWSIEIPYGLSILAFHDPRAEVRGLRDFPREEWPDVRSVHVFFQIMVAAGLALALFGVIAILLFGRKGAVIFEDRRFLRVAVLLSPLGFLALEAGWMVTEKGRQPWIIQGVMRTAESVTPMPMLAVPFWSTVVLYLLLGVAVLFLLGRQITPGDGTPPDGGGA